MKTLLAFALLFAGAGASAHADVCISTFNTQNGKSGVYETTCTGQKTFSTFTRGNSEGNKRLEQDLVTSALSQRGFVRAGLYFRTGVILHMNRSVSTTDTYCLLATKDVHWMSPAEAILDCNEGALINIEPSSLNDYLADNGYQYVESADSKYTVWDGKNLIGAKLQVYKRERR